MELINPTPLPGLAFRQFDQNGDLDCVVTLRGTFEHVQNEPAKWSDHQMPLQWQDSYEGDPQQTPMIHQGDLVPEKPGTDVTFLGASYAPEGLMQQWQCGLSLGTVDKTLNISGPRLWQPVTKEAGWPLRRREEISGWKLAPPEPASHVPIDWRLAAGGSNAFGLVEPDPDNPIGCGRIGPMKEWQNRPVPAPQITAVGPVSPADPPAGLAPVPPFLRQRYRYAGTYDDAWLTSRHPLLPQDFDPLFWQCAPEDQIVQPWLRGYETYRLTNLHREIPQAQGQLPGLQFAVSVDRGEWLPLNLDGVQFDWREEALLLLTWRVRFPLPEAQGVKLNLAWQWLPEAEVAA